ncbi:MAG: hypothetical protein COA94_04410 [Rickettsiales bacterium]|nr:MAG: hypothetical protein COA94_04410 [Rickettsiales bacterium]
MDISKGVSITGMLGPVDEFVAKATSQQELVLEDFNDQVSVRHDKLGAISELQMLLTDLKAKATRLSDPMETGFNHKHCSTTINGESADKFLKNVRVDGTVSNGHVHVAVEQVASGASLTIAFNAQHTGFTNDANPIGLDGDLTLTIGGNARIINVAAADNLGIIVSNINLNFENNGDAFEAFLINGNPGGVPSSFIEIRAKNTGFEQIGIAWADIGNPAMTMLEHAHLDGQDAIVYVEGVRYDNASNKYDNAIAGLSFELAGAVNVAAAVPNLAYNGFDYSAICTEEDHDPVKKMIIEFANSLDMLTYFVAKHGADSDVSTIDKYADPYADKSKDDQGGVLRGSMLLVEATQIVERFTGLQHNGNGITSIAQMGMGLKTTVQDGISFETLYFSDEDLFVKKFEDDFESVRRFFINHVQVTPTPGNLSSLQYIPTDMPGEVITPSIIGRDLPVSITYDPAGAVTAFSVTADGQVVNGAITYNASLNRYSISFAGTALKGMAFSVDPKAANNVVENFTINYTRGISNLVRDEARTMLSDDGSGGSTIAEAGRIQDRIKSLETSRDKIQAKLEKLKGDMQADYKRMILLETKSAIALSQADALLGLNDG